MKLILQTAIVFFGTLVAAALVALGEPGNEAVEMTMTSAPPQLVASMFGLQE